MDFEGALASFLPFISSVGLSPALAPCGRGFAELLNFSTIMAKKWELFLP